MNRSWHWQLHTYRKNLDDWSGCTRSVTATMDPTTLVTFLFKAPPEARTVELLGSWDNFSQPYEMHHDRRRGTGYWSGCFKFRNIIFDGDTTNWTKPRTGGLKQGGTYWYFYRLNDDVEACDHSEPSTASCPLLPGQTVNVIDVPVEVSDSPIRERSASFDFVDTLARETSTQTLDPEDKFAALDPPPISKLHDRCISDLALSGGLESKAQSCKSQPISPPASSILDGTYCASPVHQPLGRYYAAGEHNQGSIYSQRSSIDSGRSWYSRAPSLTGSSVYNAYGVTSDVDPFDLTPVREESRSGLEHATSIPYYEDVEVEFDESFVSAASEASFEHSSGELGRYDDGPISTCEVETYGSRPTTSSGEVSHRDASPNPAPDDVQDEDQVTYGDWSPSSEHSSPRQSSEQHVPEPSDILSPTFSAATISSRGLNTPYHLSAGCSRTTSAYAIGETPHESDAEHSIEGVAERLRNLDASYESDSNVTALRSTAPRKDHCDANNASSLSFTGYALPPQGAEGGQSVQSLDKIAPSHGRTGIFDETPLLSTAIQQEGEAHSFSDSIFSELGFL